MTRDEALAAIAAEGQAFEMAVEDVRGTPLRVHQKRMRSLREVAQAALRHGDRECVVYGDQRLSYTAFFEGANAVSHALTERFGVAGGDRVAILAANCPEWALAFWGTLNVGAVVVGVNGWAKADELMFFLRDSGSRVLVADRKRLARIAERLDELPDLRHVILIDPEESEGDASHVPFADLVSKPRAAFPEGPIDEDDPAVILYTSGTTGRPKGAVGTHRSWIAAVQHMVGIRVAAAMSDPAKAGSRDAVALACMPFFHVSGAYGALVLHFLAGTKLVMPEGRFEAGRVLELIERESITNVAAVPTMLWRMCQHPDVDRYDLSSVRSTSYGGAPSGDGLREQILRLFPNVPPERLANAYGLTETSGVALVADAEECRQHPGTVGKAALTLEVQVVDDGGQPAPVGRSGEVWLRAPFVFAGYWNRPDATAEAITDGWLRTGDVGYLDADGYLTISDRKKDMIIRGGENVYCGEIEDRLQAHPKVIDAAVVGVAHPELGEEVKAVVQLGSRNDVTAEALQAWVRETLADFKVPSIVELRTEALPRNPSGKLIKAALKGAGQNLFEELL